jgi:hypothetical protein
MIDVCPRQLWPPIYISPAARQGRPPSPPDRAAQRGSAWYHRYLTTATAQAAPNIAFVIMLQENTIFGLSKAGFVYVEGLPKTNYTAITIPLFKVCNAINKRLNISRNWHENVLAMTR